LIIQAETSRRDPFDFGSRLASRKTALNHSAGYIPSDV
jgi:hypothetical protein